MRRSGCRRVVLLSTVDRTSTVDHQLTTDAQTALAGCRFVVLVSGTLVYSRGDEKEAQHLEEEVAPAAPEAESLLPGRDGPTTPQAVPVAGSAPISMRQTPSSFKAGTLPAQCSRPPAQSMQRGSYLSGAVVSLGAGAAFMIASSIDTGTRGLRFGSGAEHDEHPVVLPWQGQLPSAELERDRQLRAAAVVGRRPLDHMIKKIDILVVASIVLLVTCERTVQAGLLAYL